MRHNLLSWITMLVLAATTGELSAQHFGPNSLMRWLGWGWSDGYHAPPCHAPPPPAFSNGGPLPASGCSGCSPTVGFQPAWGTTVWEKSTKPLPPIRPLGMPGGKISHRVQPPAIPPGSASVLGTRTPLMRRLPPVDESSEPVHAGHRHPVAHWHSTLDSSQH